MKLRNDLAMVYERWIVRDLSDREKKVSSPAMSAALVDRMAQHREHFIVEATQQYNKMRV
jgi:hypothetical protein